MNWSTLYDDPEIACHETALLIRRYYPWGSKRIPYASIKAVRRLPIRVRRWRLWGSGDLRHWWNFDPHRPNKTVALELDTGHWIRPTITPDEIETVEGILEQRIGRPMSHAGVPAA
jgi:hypothetical protein